jgi:hypothetical protein
MSTDVIPCFCFCSERTQAHSDIDVAVDRIKARLLGRKEFEYYFYVCFSISFCTAFFAMASAQSLHSDAVAYRTRSKNIVPQSVLPRSAPSVLFVFYNRNYGEIGRVCSHLEDAIDAIDCARWAPPDRVHREVDTTGSSNGFSGFVCRSPLMRNGASNKTPLQDDDVLYLLRQNKTLYVNWLDLVDDALMLQFESSADLAAAIIKCIDRDVTDMHSRDSRRATLTWDEWERIWEMLKHCGAHDDDIDVSSRRVHLRKV